MTTITHSTGVIVPKIVDGYTAKREARTIVHTVLNRPSPDITLRAASIRRGEFKCVFGGEVEAVDAFAILSIPQVFTISDPDVPSIYMTFVVAEGDLALELDEATRSVWLVRVPFVEVGYSTYSPALYPSSGLFPGGS